MFVTPAFAQDETPDDPVDLPPVSEPAEMHGETVHIEGEHSSFPPFNGEFFPSQILWLAITFGIFYLVLQRTILPRISGILENRRDRIAIDLDAAERMKTDADEAKAAYEQNLAEARERAHAIAHEARESARRDADAERARLDADLDGKLEESQKQIEETKRAAMGQVSAIAEDTTEAIVSEVVGLKVSRDEVASAVRSVRGQAG